MKKIAIPFAGTGILLLGLFLSSGLLPSYGQNPESFCSERRFPPEIGKMVLDKFPGWRVKTNEDLDPNHQLLWQQNRFMECPGISRGHFTGFKEEDFGLMLIPDRPDRKGFKILVISFRGKARHPVLFVLREESNQDQERFVVYQAPKGKYSDFRLKNEIELLREGIAVEDLEMGSSLYYWNKNRFERLDLVR